MKIDWRKGDSQARPFEDIPVGGIFRDGPHLFMKLNQEKPHVGWNAVWLMPYLGKKCLIEPTRLVIPKDATLVVEEE